MKILLRNLCKSYNNIKILDHISFTALPGVTCIMGPSGKGKTTLLRILLGLETPDSGEVICSDLYNPSEAKKICRWSAVFQEDRLLEHLDAWENLRFALPLIVGTERSASGASTSITGIKPSVTDMERLLNELGLQNISGKPVRSWSGGMKRRLALARALLVDCDALALDEPFTGLDEKNRKKAIACIARAAENIPVILVTHQKEDADALHAQPIYLQ